MVLRRSIEQLEPGLTIIDGDREQTVASARIDITTGSQPTLRWREMDSNLRSPTVPLPYSGTQVLLPFGVSSLCRRRRTGRRSAFRLRKSRSARDRRAPWSLAAGGGSGNGGSGCWAPRRLRSTMMPLWLLVWRGLPCWISGLTSVKWLTRSGGLLAPFRPPPSLAQSRSLVFLGDLVHAGWTGASVKPVF